MENLQEISTWQDELEVSELHCAGSTVLFEIKT
jgi:hypothetical protein